MEMKKNSSKFTERTSIGLIWLGIILILLGTVLFIWNDTIFVTYSTIQADKVGQFGDFVGGIIGSIWALAGVILFYVALTEQRKEFKLTREVFLDQSEIYKKQSETLELQQFESTYFNMLQLHHQIVGSIDYDDYNDITKKTKTVTSRDCFKGFYDQLNKSLQSKVEQTTDTVKAVNESYSKVYASYQSDLGPYFRNLYNILKFIKRKQPGDKNDRFYSNLLRAQLSNFELKLLFYHCLSELGTNEFKGYVEKYQFFKEMPTQNDSVIMEYRELYEPEAFGMA
jgi:hypothetical protein